MEPVLDIQHLTRTFGKVVANNDVSLSVSPGQIVGLLGHNGAGKTTLVNQVVGLLKPDSGSISVAGVDAVAHPSAARRRVALQPQAQAPIDGMTPLLAIELAGRIRGLSSRDAKASARSLVEELDLGEWATRRAIPEGGGLSGGVRRLTSFAMTLAAPTPLLVLDEPTNDVDAARRRLLWNALRRRGDSGIGVLVVTHNVTEAERVVDDLVVLHRGDVVASGSPGALRGENEEMLRLEVHLPPGAGDPTVNAQVRVESRVRAGRRIVLGIRLADAARAVEWTTRLRRENLIDSYTLSPTTLEDTYLSLTADSEERENAHV